MQARIRSLLKNKSNLSAEELREFWHVDGHYLNLPDNIPVAHYLLANEDISLVTKMLGAMSPVDLASLQDFEAKTLLILSAKLGPVADSLTRYLLDNVENFGGNALLDVQDTQGRSALHYLYLYGNTELILKLRDLGANVSLLDKAGKKPECYLFEMEKQTVSEIGREISMEFDRSLDAKCNFLNGGGNSKLGIPSYVGNAILFDKPLLEHPKDLQRLIHPDNSVYKIRKERTVLLTSAEKEALFDSYSYLKNSRTMLDHILENRMQATEILQPLLSAKGIQRMVKKYKLRDDSVSELEKGLRNAVVNQNVMDAKQLLASKVDPNSSSPSNGSTPLHYAAQKGSTALISLLLEYGANPNKANHENQLPDQLAKAPQIKVQLDNAKSLRGGEEKEIPSQTLSSQVRQSEGFDIRL